MKYIEESAAIAKICGAKCGIHHHECVNNHNCEEVDLLKSTPAADVVSRAAFDQVRLERDICLEQLGAISKGLGQKMDDVATVVRCKDCMYFDKGENVSESWEWCTMINRETGLNGYCHLGDRKEI